MQECPTPSRVRAILGAVRVLLFANPAKEPVILLCLERKQLKPDLFRQQEPGPFIRARVSVYTIAVLERNSSARNPSAMLL
jgi:hypothetical protein